MGTEAATLLTDLQSFIATPFRPGMDIFSVFLGVGLVIVAIILWSRVLAHVSHAI